MAQEPIHISEHVSLRTYNTFGIEAFAERFVEITCEDQLREVAAFPGRKQVLGGGSNILLLGDVKGLVLCNRLKGRKLIRETATHVWIEVGSGEVWHDLVLFAILNGWGGLENLALIPGTVGAAPIQNIGAYGCEAKDVIDEVNFFSWENGTVERLPNAGCRFGYRDSVFKHELRDKVFITSVVFRLTKNPVVNTQYGAIANELAAMGVSDPGIMDVAEAVIRIRSSKLPDPRITGNAGSFFKNPEIPLGQYEALAMRFPDMPSYDAGPGMKKIPAGWLIEQCGWKGRTEGQAGVHAKQALVLVNMGGATGQQILSLSDKVVASVQECFGLGLEREVQLW